VRPRRQGGVGVQIGVFTGWPSAGGLFERSTAPLLPATGARGIPLPRGAGRRRCHGCRSITARAGNQPGAAQPSARSGAGRALGPVAVSQASKTRRSAQQPAVLCHVKTWAGWSALTRERRAGSPTADRQQGGSARWRPAQGFVLPEACWSLANWMSQGNPVVAVRAEGGGNLAR